MLMDHWPYKDLNRQNGSTLIETLVSMLILLIAVLGLTGLQVQAQQSEMESYQRAQALILLQDMVGRVNANRKVAGCYAVTTDTANGTPYFGTNTSITTPTCTLGTSEQQALAVRDMEDWNNLLLGAAEVTAGSKVGAMIGARGCVDYDAATDTYTVTVAWQGLGKTFTPAGQKCGQGQYGHETLRRVVSLSVKIANLL
jgi:type IV pilus assembly protein PilV